MIYIHILHGSSCVGKSTFMNNENNKYNKVEMDDCKYWLFKEAQWTHICINYLVENIINNFHKSDMIVTCGGLPLPNHAIYSQLEEEYSIKFIHRLILVKNMEKYKSYIKQRNRDDIMDILLNQYKWRESTKEIYDDIIWT
jgi:hypothetical protein